MTTGQTILRRLPLIGIVIAAVLGAWFLSDILNFRTLADNQARLIAFRDQNYALAVVLFMSAYIAIVALSLPGATIATLTGGFLFGLFPGTLYNVMAATTGACLLHLAVRAGLGDRLAKRMDASDGAVRRLKEGIDANQWSMLFLMRLVPAVPFFVANLIPAMVGVSLFRFAVSTFFGIIPGAVVFTSVGAGLGDVISAGQRPDLGIIFTPPILLPILGIAALAALPILIRLLKRT